MPRLTDNLLAWYNFDGALTDASGNGRTLDAGGNDTYTTGLIGQCVDGGDPSKSDWISGVNWRTAPWTISMWFKVPAPADGFTGGTVALTVDAPGGGIFQLYAFSDAVTWNFGLTFGNSGETLYPMTGSGPWHHALLTWTGSVAAIYVDGALAGTPTGTIPNATTNTYFGVSTEVDSQTPADLVGLWQRALSASEIAVLYNGGVGVSYAQIAAPEVLPPVRVFRRPDLPTDPIFTE